MKKKGSLSLQTKLSVVLLGGTLAIYLGSCVFQYVRNQGALHTFSEAICAQGVKEYSAFIKQLQEAIRAPLLDAMREGEMGKFEKILTRQREVPGLQEVSLHDQKGRAAYSTVPARLKQGLPEELMSKVLSAGENVQRRTADAFEYYSAIPADKACIECHTTWKENEICGVMVVKYSSGQVQQTEQSWVSFREDMKRASAFNSGITALALAVSLALLIGLTVHFQLTRPLKVVAGNLDLEAEQVSHAAAQLASQSQSLAEGASEQASSLEETSASIEEMASMTRNNADHARQAMDIARETRQAAETGVSNMREMDSAMASIQAAGDDISKIIKTIDEIAFQTNVLALNAAVEAARAGAAGSGFAVVAGEVRSLAQRSAEAAKETTVKIVASLERTKQGVGLSNKVGGALNEVVTRARKLDELASAVAVASKEQGEGVAQLNSAVNQVDQVTQSNAANSEESAAAARELDVQAAGMKHAVAELRQLVGAKLAEGKSAQQGGWLDNPSNISRPPSGGLKADSISPPTTRDLRDLIVWDEAEMATGVGSVDKQHQELIGMINRLHRACRAGAGKEELEQMMRFLAEYVVTHFQHEEAVMEQHGCSSKGANRLAHQKFLKSFEQLRQNFTARGPNTAMLLDLRRLVGEWLTLHICSVDNKLRQCPLAQTVGRARSLSKDRSRGVHPVS